MKTINPDAQQLAPASIKVQQIPRFIFAAFLAVACAVAFFFGVNWAGWICVGLTTLQVILAIIIPPLRYRRTHYWLEPQGLYIQRGIWWRKCELVPRNRIQHCDVTQGPLQRKFDLGTLVVHTAGTSNASVSLGGLLHDTAFELRHQLLENNSGIEDAV